jgi:hypothetical protein
MTAPIASLAGHRSPLVARTLDIPAIGEPVTDKEEDLRQPGATADTGAPLQRWFGDVTAPPLSAWRGLGDSERLDLVASLAPVVVALTPAGRSATYDPSQVLQAVHQVRDVFRDGTAWKSELESSARTVASLTPAERRSFVNHLARENSANGSLLQRWLGEVTAPGVGPWGGLDASARRDLLADLVAGQDGANLERVFHGLVDHQNRFASPYQDEFAAAVAAQGTRDQKVELIRRLDDDAVRGDPGASRAIGTLMTSDPRITDRALEALSRRGMDAVVAASVSVHRQAVANGYTANVVSWTDTRRHEALASAVAGSSNPVEKSSFVAASGKLLKELPIDARPALTAGMSKVIGSDVNGVIENTLLQNTRGGASDGRRALKNYAEALIDTNQHAHLGAITLSLQRGNDLKHDPMQWLSAPLVRSGEAPSFARARVMGDWLGIVGSAVNTRTTSRDQQMVVGALMFTGSADVLKELTSAAFPQFKVAIGVANAVIKPAVNASIIAFRTEFARADRDFVRALYEGALPRHPNGVEATGVWVTTMNAQFNTSLTRQ